MSFADSMAIKAVCVYQSISAPFCASTNQSAWFFNQSASTDFKVAFIHKYYDIVFSSLSALACFLTSPRRKCSNKLKSLFKAAAIKRELLPCLKIRLTENVFLLTLTRTL